MLDKTNEYSRIPCALENEFSLVQDQNWKRQGDLMKFKKKILSFSHLYPPIYSILPWKGLEKNAHLNSSEPH